MTVHRIKCGDTAMGYMLLKSLLLLLWCRPPCREKSNYSRQLSMSPLVSLHELRRWRKTVQPDTYRSGLGEIVEKSNDQIALIH